MKATNHGPNGLIFPSDLAAWQEWQNSKRKLQRGKAAVVSGIRGAVTKLRGGEPAESAERVFSLATRAGETAGIHTVIGIDSNSPTAIANSLSILPFLQGTVSVLHPANLTFDLLSGSDWNTRELANPVAEIRELNATAVVTLGHFLGAGRILHEAAKNSATEEFVLQHGALTPYAPPLPSECTLLAWSDADAAFWTANRPDVEAHTVGSQHLWEAAQNPIEGEIADQPIFLGQLHGAELSRRVTGASAWVFCKENDAAYRPHPREEDALSRAQHALWRKRGMQFAPTSVPLNQLSNPVVGVFSTGILEAAVRGVPSWAFAVNEPQWVREFWDRYSMSVWGSNEPTPAPAMIDVEPATRIARVVEGGAQ